MSADSENFPFSCLDLTSVSFLSKLLKNYKIYNLHLTDVNVETVKDLAQSLKGNIAVKRLLISPCNIGDQAVRCIADILKDTKIIYLGLAYTNIREDGIGYLAQRLKESQVVELDIAGNQLGHNGLKTLANIWNDGKIRMLHFSDNKFKVTFSKIKGKMFRNADNEDIWPCVNYPNRRINYVPVSEMLIKRTIINDDINHFVNNFFSEIISIFDQFNWLSDKNIEYLRNATRGVKIKVLYITFVDNYISISMRIHDILIDHLMNKLNFFTLSEFYYYTNFLNDMVSHFRINHIRDTAYFIDTLKSSNIRYLSILCTADGGYINYEEPLADAIKHTKIVKLDLANILIKDIQIFIDKLSNTHIVHLKLHAILDAELANSLADIIEHTQLISIDFTKNPSENVPTEGYMASLCKNKTLAHKINSAFNNLVSLNPENKKLEFTTPKNSSPLDLYATFIEILYKKPNLSAHIIYDRLEIAEEIDEFMDNLQDHFNRFLNSNILSLIKKYDQIDFINLIKKFDSANLDQIVENMLLHRTLYYIDENEEILHPFIYKMLHQYKLPLYQKEMEPNKKLDIINYYKTHPEIQDIQEAIELLEM